MSVRISFLFILMSLLGASGSLEAVVFPLDMGRLGRAPGELEVARDPEFQQVIVKIPLGGRQEYLVNLEQTGVYYIRVKKQGKILWEEALLALVDAAKPNQMPRLEWDKKTGSQRYRIWLCRDNVKTRWVETHGLAVHLQRIGAPWLIRLRSINVFGNQSALNHLRFSWADARNSWDVPDTTKTAEKPLPPPAPEVKLDPTAKDDDQVVYEPEDKDLLTGAESPMDFFLARVRPKTLGPLVRQHVLQGWLRYLHETFVIDKKDRFAAVPTNGLGTGMGGQYFLQPNLSISGSLDTHATKTEYDQGGSESPSPEQKRVRAHLGLGLDLFNTNNRWTDWSLNLGPVLGFLQIPLQQDDQKFMDGGLKLSVHSYEYRLSFSFLLLKSSSRELVLQGSLPWTIWSLRPFMSFYRYDTRQSAGSVTGTFQESGLRLGIEREF